VVVGRSACTAVVVVERSRSRTAIQWGVAACDGGTARSRAPPGTTSYAWDGNGNLTSSTDGNSYTWTSTNMMATAAEGAVSAEYEYDATGVRIGVDGQDWIWDRAASIPILINDGQTSLVGGLASAEDGQIRWSLTDRLGSVRVITDDGGDQIGSAEYSAFGQTREQYGSDGPLGFTSQYSDPTGLLHLRARQYDPSTGRLLSGDTVQPNGAGTQGFNLHSYVAGAPTSASDPTGHMPLLEYGSRVGQASNVAMLLGQVNRSEGFFSAGCQATSAGGGAAGIAALIAKDSRTSANLGGLGVVFAAAGLVLTALDNDHPGEVWQDPAIVFGAVATGFAVFAVATSPNAAGWASLALSAYSLANC